MNIHNQLAIISMIIPDLCSVERRLFFAVSTENDHLDYKKE